MRQPIFVCAALLALSALANAGQAAPAGPEGPGSAEQLSHAIYVKVNGKTITQENVMEAVKYLIRREYNNKPPHDMAEMERIQKAALRDLVRTILIHDEAARLGIKPDRSYSRRSMAQSGLKPDEVTPTIRRMLEADDLFSDLMMGEGTPISQPTPKQLRDFYTKNREEFRTNQYLIVRTIFVAADPRRPQAYYRDQAESLMRRIEAVPLESRTAFFEQTAREVSQDMFARYGGLLTGESPEPWIPREFENTTPDGEEMLPGPMADGIRRLTQRGELRLAVTQDGMHILYCEDVRGGQVIGWDEASKIIDYVLRQRQKNARMQSWLNRVYDRSDVRWHDGTVFEKQLLTESLLPSEKNPLPE